MAVEASPSGTGGDFPPLGEVFDFLRLICAVDHGVHRLSKRMETALGVTAPQRLALRIVGRFPGIGAGTLAEILRFHPGTLTGVLQRLERRGMVARRPDSRDRRRVLLGLTGRGRALDAPTPGTVEHAVSRAIGGLPRLKLAAARDVLELLARALEEEALAGEGRRPRGESRRRPTARAAGKRSGQQKPERDRGTGKSRHPPRAAPRPLSERPAVKSGKADKADWRTGKARPKILP